MGAVFSAKKDKNVNKLELNKKSPVNTMMVVAKLRKGWEIMETFREIFNLRDDKAKGRTMVLTATLLQTIYNVFITGTLYTGFLTMYGMSITDSGIVTVCNYLGYLLCIFSPKILSRFRRRKGVLLTVKVIYYAVYILVPNIIPRFISDPHDRMVGFSVITIASVGFLALFIPGYTAWYYGYYPEDTERRTRYLVFSQNIVAILSGVVLLGSSFLTDALNNSPYQEQLILGFRYLAFALVLLEVFALSRVKEPSYQDSEHPRLSDVFTLPFRNKKFMACMWLMFAWSFCSNMHNGTWTYHLMNHLGFSYMMINFISLIYPVILLLFSPLWTKVLRRFSWIKTLGIGILLLAPMEFIFFFMTPERGFLYLPVSLVQNVMLVGINISYANVLYMNLPQENSTAYISFNTIGCNVFCLLGVMTGTYITSITDDNTISLLGMEVYSFQFTLILKGVLLVGLGVLLILKWRSFTSEEVLAELEHRKAVSKNRRKG